MTKNMLGFEPMRSLIYVDVAKEDYRVKLENWLYKYHIPDSISQFGPYVSKYAFYQALPVPEGGERFGAIKMQLTEHYWLANPNNIAQFDHHQALTEFFPPDVLKWQGNLPDEDFQCENVEGDEARAVKGDASKGTVPFIFAFVPVWWEEDYKGAGRTIEDGPNYRWQMVIKFPDDAKDTGDKWLRDEFIPAFVECEETTRILSSKVIKEANGCEFDRVVEMWFEGPSAWKAAVDKAAKKVRRPAWFETEDFPYLTQSYGISSVFLSDIARSDNMTQYNGYITMR